MFGVAPRLNVQVGFIARRALRLHGIVLVLRGQLLDAIEDLLAGQKALLDPSRRAACSAYFGEAPVVVEHFHALAVRYHSGFFIHRRNVVAQVGLQGGNIGNLQHAFASAIAARKKYRAAQAQRNRRRSKRNCRDEFHRTDFKPNNYSAGSWRWEENAGLTIERLLIRRERESTGY